MFSKSLFKQSCKANGTMWLVITLAVCFMLSCVMLISGGGGISETKEAIQDTIIEGEITSSVEDKALTYYDIGNTALEHFDTVFATEYQSAVMSAAQTGVDAETAGQQAFPQAYANAVEELQTVYLPQLYDELGLKEGSQDAEEVKGIIFYVLNPMTQDGSYMFDSFYEDQGETPLHYTELLTQISEANHVYQREKYVMNNASSFLAGNLVQDENIEAVLEKLSDYGVTEEQYDEFGFSDYANVKEIVKAAVVDYRANMEYRTDNLPEGEEIETVKEEVHGNVCGSLLSALPQEVSDALDEIGQMDMYGILVGSIFFKMAGLLLPIIYMIMSSNALIAGQVDSGSMAYILSTSTKRRTVTFTQAVYLIGSLLVMFLCTAITSVICLKLVDVETGLTSQKLILLNLGAFLSMFAMSGICFLASCWFDRSKRAMALGGGLSMFFLVATMLGLFGSPILPSIIRLSELNYFNYASIITLFDPISILDGTNTYLWKFGILIAIGLVCYIIGSIRFRKKDLPL